MPAAHPRMAQHGNGPIPVQLGVDAGHPLARAAEGEMNHGVGQPGQFQFLVFAHIHQLDGFPLGQACVQIPGADRFRGGHGGQTKG